MARLCGVVLPNNKRVEIGLTYIYGIGRSKSKEILDKLNINMDVRVKDLTEADLAKLRDALGKEMTEGDLRRKVHADVQRLQTTGTYRGFRHRRRLPSRGQRSKTNARTRRGKKSISAPSGKRKESKK